MHLYTQLTLVWLWAADPAPVITVEAGVYDQATTIAPLTLEWSPTEGFSVGARVEITKEHEHGQY